MNKLLIIDGSALLFQSFYGMPNKIINNKGQYVEAVVCFTGIMLKTIKQVNPHKVLILFDGETHLYRQDIDENYKSNRIDYSKVEDCDNPYAQLDLIKRVLDHLRFAWIETSDCEADDMIASIVNDYKTMLEIVISSPDKDFYQLIDDNVGVFTYRGKVSKLWTRQEIINKYGFDAGCFASFKALIGDKSDNIKGIKGIGYKTAIRLIQGYGNINEIFENINNINPRVAQLLTPNKQLIYQNYKIIELFSKKGLVKLPDCDYELPDESSTAILKSLDIL